MKITILCENEVGYENAEVCLAEWGLSLHVATKNVNILFDVGHTDVYKKNAKALGIDLQKVDFVTLSHHHWDHIGGLDFFNSPKKKCLITHPEVLSKISLQRKKKFGSDFQLTLHRDVFEFSPNIFYLGEIPRMNDYEGGGFEDDTMCDDSAIAIKTKNGAIVISGCSHSGICNICEYAKKITGQQLYAVIGGFHLFREDDVAVKKTLEYFHKENPRYIYPMHCTDFFTLTKFSEAFSITKCATGDTIDVEE